MTLELIVEARQCLAAISALRPDLQLLNDVVVHLQVSIVLPVESCPEWQHK